MASAFLGAALTQSFYFALSSTIADRLVDGSLSATSFIGRSAAVAIKGFIDYWYKEDEGQFRSGLFFKNNQGEKCTLVIRCVSGITSDMAPLIYVKVVYGDVSKNAVKDSKAFNALDAEFSMGVQLEGSKWVLTKKNKQWYRVYTAFDISTGSRAYAQYVPTIDTTIYVCIVKNDAIIKIVNGDRRKRTHLVLEECIENDIVKMDKSFKI